MTYGNVTDDISFTYSTSAYRFKVAKDKDGNPIYHRRLANLLPRSMPTGQVGISNTTPNELLIREQVNFSKGMGQRTFQDENAYYDAADCDATSPGKVTLSAYQSAIDTIAPSVTNGGAETNDLTGWTKESGASTMSASAAKYNEGSYSFLAGGECLYYQDLTVSSYASKTIYVSAALYGAGGTGIRIGVNDGVDTTWSTRNTNAAWSPRLVKHTCNASATRVRIYIDAEEINDYVDSIKVCYPTRFCQFGSTLYQARGATLETWSGTAWATISATVDGGARNPLVFLHDITDLKVYADAMYVSVGSAYVYLYTTDGIAYTSNAGSATAKERFSVVGTTLYASDNTYNLYSSTSAANAKAGTWSAATVVGDVNFNITHLFDHQGSSIYLMKEDGLWQIVAGTPTLILDLHTDLHDDTGKRAVIWHGDMYLPTGNGALFRLEDIATFSNISPGNPVGYFYRSAALVGDSEYLAAIQSDGTDGYVLRGHYATVGGDSGWYWHPVAKLSGMTAVTDAIIFSDSGKMKLFVAGSPGTVWTYTPVDYGNWRLASVGGSGGAAGDDWVASGTFTTSKHDGGFPTENKAFYSVTFDGRSNYTNSTHYYSVAPYYSIDGGAYTLLSATDPNATDDCPQTWYFPAGTNGKTILFRFTLSQVAGTYAPELWSYSWEGQLLDTAKRYRWEMTLDVSTCTVNKGGSTTTQSPKAAITSLNTLIETGDPVTLTDIEGNTYYVTFQDIDDHTLHRDMNDHRDHRVAVSLLEARWNA